MAVPQAGQAQVHSGAAFRMLRHTSVLPDPVFGQTPYPHGHPPDTQFQKWDTFGPMCQAKALFSARERSLEPRQRPPQHSIVHLLDNLRRSGATDAQNDPANARSSPFAVRNQDTPAPATALDRKILPPLPGKSCRFQ